MKPSVSQPRAAGSTRTVKPVMAPSARSRSTRRFTAGADSPTIGADVRVGAAGVLGEGVHDAFVEIVQSHCGWITSLQRCGQAGAAQWPAERRMP